MDFDRLKREVALLGDCEQAELIDYILQLRYSRGAMHRREITERLNDTTKTHWLTPDEFERRLKKN